MSGLFDDLPAFPVARPDDELRLMARLPDWPTITEVDDDEHAACRRLERAGLVKVCREKNDPSAIRPTWYAGRMAASRLRQVPA